MPPATECGRGDTVTLSSTNHQVTALFSSNRANPCKLATQSVILPTDRLSQVGRRLPCITSVRADRTQPTFGWRRRGRSFVVHRASDHDTRSHRRNPSGQLTHPRRSEHEASCGGCLRSIVAARPEPTSFDAPPCGEDNAHRADRDVNEGPARGPRFAFVARCEVSGVRCRVSGVACQSVSRRRSRREPRRRSRRPRRARARSVGAPSTPPGSHRRPHASPRTPAPRSTRRRRPAPGRR